MQKKNYKINRNMRRTIVFLVETLLILVIVACCYVISKLDKMEQSTLDASDIVKPTYQQKESEYAEELETGYKNIMVLGIDASADDSISLSESVRSDVIMICSINNATKDVKLISIYRDTYLKMMDGGFNKANNQSFETGVLDAMNMLNTNLDLAIDDYVVVNWAAVANVINLLGGIEVEVTDTMLSYKNQINGYITEIVNSTGIGSVQVKEPGYQLLDGVQTVAYSRVRYQNGDDYGRTQRQREVISKLLAKAKKASPATWNSIADAIFPQIATSLDLTEILAMVPNLMKYTITDTAGFPFVSESVDKPIGPEDVREAVFAVDLKTNVVQLHKLLYDKDDYQPSDSVLEINDEIVDHCGLVPSENSSYDENYLDGALDNEDSNDENIDNEDNYDNEWDENVDTTKASNSEKYTRTTEANYDEQWNEDADTATKASNGKNYSKTTEANYDEQWNEDADTNTTTSSKYTNSTEANYEEWNDGVDTNTTASSKYTKSTEANYEEWNEGVYTNTTDSSKYINSTEANYEEWDENVDTTSSKYTKTTEANYDEQWNDNNADISYEDNIEATRASVNDGRYSSITEDNNDGEYESAISRMR